MSKIILETPRLYLREMGPADFADLAEILQNPAVMYAYEHTFDDAGVRGWLERQIPRYAFGWGMWAAIVKATGAMAGQCGLTLQPWRGREVPEIGYLFKKAYWGNGYAAEAAQGCKKYAFEVLGLDTVYSIIRDTNLASQKVAQKNGMRILGACVKLYAGKNMPHLVFGANNPLKNG